MTTTFEQRPMALVGRNHRALHTPAAEITDADDEIRTLASRMYATVIAQRGLALAAPQVGASVRMIVSRDGNVSINPVLRGHSETTELGAESCLSLPCRSFNVERYTEVQGAAFVPSASGDALLLKEFTVEGALARLWQHELEHLDGHLISDRWPEIRGGS